MSIEEDMEKYANSKRHRLNCDAYGEGLDCCLNREKGWVADYVRAKLRDLVEDIKSIPLDDDPDDTTDLGEKWGARIDTAVERACGEEEKGGESKTFEGSAPEIKGMHP